jgi:uncharacterized protein
MKLVRPGAAARYLPDSRLLDPVPESLGSTRNLSDAAKHRMLSKRGEPLFLATWDRAVFLHYEVDPAQLQRAVPFALDLHNERAFVSVVAFTLWRMRPCVGGRLTEWLFKPIASHGFLNIRTYVQHQGELGIFFLAEWLSNPLSIGLGPRTFGLPYRFGHLAYEHPAGTGELQGTVASREGRLEYRASVPAGQFCSCEAAWLTEFLLERYTAFTHYGRRRRLFRVWHEPWSQIPINIAVTAHDLIASTGDWWQTAQLAGANFSPGVNVWMGRPHRIAC